MERFSIDSAVQGFHVYGIQKLAKCLCANRNLGTFTIPIYAVSVVCEDNIIVGHVPRTILALCYFFLRRNGTILC